MSRTETPRVTKVSVSLPPGMAARVRKGVEPDGELRRRGFTSVSGVVEHGLRLVLEAEA